MMYYTRTEIIDELERRIKVLWEMIAKFENEVNANPSHALKWAQSTFEVAAKLEVSQHLLELFEGGKEYDKIRKIIKDRIMNKAANPAFSTSVTSNLMDTCLTAAYAYEFDSFNGLLSSKTIKEDA